MSIRAFIFSLVLSPVASLAQSPPPVQARETPNATMLAVLLANRPEKFTEEQWLDMMQQPVNRSLYPLRITQTMLDTIDAAQLDRKYSYEVAQQTGAERSPRE